MKDPRDVKAIAMVDRVIQNLKTRRAESLSEEPGQWATRIKEVVAVYNKTSHSTIHGEPGEVRKNEVQQFLITQDNAERLKANQTLLELRKKQLADKGAFRRPLRGLNVFRRGVKAAYGDVEKPAAVNGSVITPQGEGAKIDIKRVMSVDRDNGEVTPWLGGLGDRDSAKKDKLVPVMLGLLECLQDEEKSVASAVVWLQANMGDVYVDIIREVGFGRHLAEAIRRFEDNFELTKGGYYVKPTG